MHPAFHGEIIDIRQMRRRRRFTLGLVFLVMLLAAAASLIDADYR